MTTQKRPPSRSYDSDHPHIQLSMTKTAHECVITVTGEWDIATRSFADSSLREAIRQAGRRMIIIDLTGLDFAGVEAVRCLAAAGRRLADTSRSLVVRLPADGPVRLLFETAGSLQEAARRSTGDPLAGRRWSNVLPKFDLSSRDGQPL